MKYVQLGLNGMNNMLSASHDVNKMESRWFAAKRNSSPYYGYRFDFPLVINLDDLPVSLLQTLFKYSNTYFKLLFEEMQMFHLS